MDRLTAQANDEDWYALVARISMPGRVHEISGDKCIAPQQETAYDSWMVAGVEFDLLPSPLPFLAQTEPQQTNR